MPKLSGEVYDEYVKKYGEKKARKLKKKFEKIDLPEGFKLIDGTEEYTDVIGPAANLADQYKWSKEYTPAERRNTLRRLAKDIKPGIKGNLKNSDYERVIREYIEEKENYIPPTDEEIFEGIINVMESIMDNDTIEDTEKIERLIMLAVFGKPIPENDWENEKGEEKKKAKIINTEQQKQNKALRTMALELINQIIAESGEKFLLATYSVGEVIRYYTLSPGFVNRIIKIAEEEGTESETVRPSGPGGKISSSDDGISDSFAVPPIAVKVSYFKKVVKQSGFFPMLNKYKDIDLSELQIYNSYKQAEKEMNAHCLINSLLKLNVDITQIREIIFQNGARPIRKFDLTRIGEIIGVRIHLTEYNDQMVRGNRYVYNDVENLPTIKLFTFKNHYMPCIKLPIAPFSVRNYNDLKNDPGFPLITKRKNGRPMKENKLFSSVTILKAMTDCNAFEECFKLRNLNPEIKTDDIKLSGAIALEQKVMNQKADKDVSSDYNIYSCDFETEVITGTHKPMMLGFINHGSKEYNHFVSNNDEKELNEVKIFVQMLDNIILQKSRELKVNKPARQKFLLYFHNMKYDYTIMRDCPHISAYRKIVKNGQMYAYQFKYRSHDFMLKDSWKLISMPLGSFGESLQIDQEKTKFDLYDITTLEMMARNLPIPIDMISDKDSWKNKDTDDNYRYMNRYVKKTTRFVKGRGIVREETFDICQCYKDYLEVDCVVLMKGLETFRILLRNVTGLDMHNYLTSSSMVHKYFTNSGVYKDVYQVSGSLQKFLMEGVVGGRVYNKDVKEYIDKIQDFDACSLYPSAMSISKFPKGMAKYLTEDKLNMDFLNTVDHYVVKVSLKLNKYQQIPMYNERDANGVRQWKNQADHPAVMSKILLEDILEHYNAEILEIHEGVYWDEGMTDAVQPIIKELYERRRVEKSNGNMSMSNVLKLIMNSSYGKTLLKPSDVEVQIIPRFKWHKTEDGVIKTSAQDRLDNYLQKNFCNVMDITETQVNWECRHSKVDLEHMNLAHIGMIILDNSKKIMNRVLAIANDNDIDIYYTDTDSIHMKDEDVEKLSKLYDEWATQANWHVKNLIGGGMLQFHCDFDSDKIKGPVWSRHFIGIAKKCYLDVLTNAEGETDYHVRFKGMSRNNIEYYCKQHGIDLVEFYRKVLRGETMAVDICKGNTRFHYDGLQVKTRESMVKIINPAELSPKALELVREAERRLNERNA